MAEPKGELYFDAELGSIIASTSYAAAYFGVVAATLSNWKQSGCPRMKHGYWDIKAVTEWLSHKDGEKVAKAAQKDISLLPLGQQKTHWEAMYKREQLEAAKLRNGIACGDYILKEQAVEELSTFLKILKASVVGLGHELGQTAGQYMDADAARQLDSLIEQRVYDALEQIALVGFYAEAGESMG